MIYYMELFVEVYVQGGPLRYGRSTSALADDNTQNDTDADNRMAILVS